MTKKKYVAPVVRRGKSKVTVIMCKSAACSGGSTHSQTIYKSAQVISLKEAA